MQTQWFADCLQCGKPHIFTREIRSDRCVYCGGALAAVGGIMDGCEVRIPLSRDAPSTLEARLPEITRKAMTMTYGGQIAFATVGAWALYDMLTVKDAAYKFAFFLASATAGLLVLHFGRVRRRLQSR